MERSFFFLPQFRVFLWYMFFAGMFGFDEYMFILLKTKQGLKSFCSYCCCSKSSCPGRNCRYHFYLHGVNAVIRNWNFFVSFMETHSLARSKYIYIGILYNLRVSLSNKAGDFLIGNSEELLSSFLFCSSGTSELTQIQFCRAYETRTSISVHLPELLITRLVTENVHLVNQTYS